MPIYRKGTIRVGRQIRSLDKEFIALQYRREGRSNSEIGRILGVSHTAVANALRRILDRYREQAKDDAQNYMVEEDLNLLDLRHKHYASLLTLDEEEASAHVRKKWLEARKTYTKLIKGKKVTVVSRSVLESISEVEDNITHMRKVRGDIYKELRAINESRRRLWGVDQGKYMPEDGDALGNVLTDVLVRIGAELASQRPKFVDGKIIEVTPSNGKPALPPAPSNGDASAQ